MNMAIYLNWLELDTILPLYGESQKILRRKISIYINENPHSSFVNDNLNSM